MKIRLWRPSGRGFYRGLVLDIAIGAAIPAVVLAYSIFVEPDLAAKPLDALEQELIRARYAFRGARQPPPEVAIIAIDDESMAELGLFPWSRSVWADFVRIMDQKYKPAALVLDVLYLDEERKLAASDLEAIRGQLAPVDGALARFDEAFAAVDPDQKFSQAMSECQVCGPTLAVKFVLPEDPEWPSPLDPETRSMLDAFSFAPGLRERMLQTYGLWIPAAKAIQAPRGEFATVCWGLGHTNVKLEGRFIDRVYPLMDFEGRGYPSLGIMVLRSHPRGQPPRGGETVVLSEDPSTGELVMALGEFRIPIDDGAAHLNFYGPGGAFPYVSFAKVFRGEAPVEALQDKIVLVGSTALSAFDHYPSPFSPNFPGVEVHATFIANALDGSFHRTLGADKVFVSNLAALALGTIASLALNRLRAFIGVVISAALIGAWFVPSWWLFGRHQVFDTAPPVVAGVLVTIAGSARRALREQRARMQLKATFQGYVSKDLLQYMLKNPGAVQLGGHTAVATVLFSDLAGFTSQAEKLPGERVAELLNLYFAEMIAAIQGHEGLVDKFIGDGIMAEFGLPISRADHAARACRSALEQVERLAKLNDDFERRGLPRIRFRIGVHTGEMKAGDFGTEDRKNYTVMGDAVNLASRLEGVNKAYGTTILVSEATHKLVEHEVEARLIDRVRVLGKEQPETLYEIMGLRGAIDAPGKEAALLYARGLEKYRERDWATAIDFFQQALQVLPEDGPSQALIGRCERYRLAPPPADWDGVYDLEKK